MNDSPLDDSVRGSALQIAGFVSAVAFVIGCMKEMGYWSVFELDIVMYMSISDYIRVAIPTILFVAPMAFIAVLFAQRIFRRQSSFTRLNLYLVNHRHSLGRAAHLLLIFVLVVLAFGIGLVMWWSGVPVFCFVIVALGCALGLTLTNAAIAKVRLPANVRALVVLVCSGVPASAWISGRMDALYLVDGRHYFEAKLSPEQRAKVGVDSETSVRFMRHVDGYDFLYAGGNLVAARSEELVAITLVARHDRSRDCAAVRMPFVQPRFDMAKCRSQVASAPSRTPRGASEVQPLREQQTGPRPPVGNAQATSATATGRLDGA